MARLSIYTEDLELNGSALPSCGEQSTPGPHYRARVSLLPGPLSGVRKASHYFSLYVNY